MSVTTSENAKFLSAHNSPREARLHFDKEIRKLKDQIRILRFRRNTFAPISRLPPEILSKAFAFVMAASVESEADLDWIKVSHVSQYWREVALDCPSLWVNLDFTWPKWCKEMLKRSKMASLAVKAEVAPIVFKSVRAAMLQGHRIHELRLSASAATISRLLFIDPPLQLPTIRSLTLLASQYDTQSFALPESIFNSEKPYLRRIDLCRCDIAWDTSLFNGLTSLTIHNIRDPARPTTKQLVDTLRRMPALEVLDLKNALPSSTLETPTTPTENTIHLTKLTELVISSTVPECASFVSRIKIPIIARISLSCVGLAGDYSGITGIFPNSAGISGLDGGGSTSKTSLRVLHIRSVNALSLTLNGWGISGSSKPLPPSDIRLHLTWQTGLSREVEESVITNICNTIHIENLRLLRFSLISAMTKKIWIDIFGVLPRLDSIYVEGESTKTLITALQESPHKPFYPPHYASTSPSNERATAILFTSSHRKQPKGPSVHFPHLKFLSIKSYDFDSMNFDDNVGLLRSCLKYRSKHKAKLQTLQLRECCHLYDDDIESLRAKVKVDWDGIVIDTSEGDASEEETGRGYW